MGFSMLPQVFMQMFKKPWTNKFPAKYQPSSTTKFLADVGEGKAQLIPPIETPPGFRGKITYDKESFTRINCNNLTNIHFFWL